MVDYKNINPFKYFSYFEYIFNQFNIFSVKTSFNQFNIFSCFKKKNLIYSQSKENHFNIFNLKYFLYPMFYQKNMFPL